MDITKHLNLYSCTWPQERFPNLAELQQERAREFREEQKAEKRSAFEKEKLAEKERIKTAQTKSYA